MARILSHGAGNRVFTPNDFFDIGDRPAINQALCRLVRSGDIRRINRGLYDLPQTDTNNIETLSIDLDLVIDAICRRDCVRALPSPNQCAYDLGLREDPPDNIVYDTDGFRRIIRIGETDIRFRRASVKVLRWYGRKSAHLAQAVRIFRPNVEQYQSLPYRLNRAVSPEIRDDFIAHSYDLPVHLQAIAKAMKDLVT